MSVSPFSSNRNRTESDRLADQILVIRVSVERLRGCRERRCSSIGFRQREMRCREGGTRRCLWNPNRAEGGEIEREEMQRDREGGGELERGGC